MLRKIIIYLVGICCLMSFTASYAWLEVLNNTSDGTAIQYYVALGFCYKSPVIADHNSDLHSTFPWYCDAGEVVTIGFLHPNVWDCSMSGINPDDNRIITVTGSYPNYQCSSNNRTIA